MEARVVSTKVTGRELALIEAAAEAAQISKAAFVKLAALDAAVQVLRSEIGPGPTAAKQ